MNDDWTPGCDVKADVPDDQKGRQYDVFEEVVVISRHLHTHGVRSLINEQVRFARKRFGRYEVIAFLAVLFGYAITGSLLDRAGTSWIVFDIDGTREAARQRALPQTDELPPPFRRLDDVCAPGNPRRKRGEVVRTRTTLAQAHS
jgi:hypothetical protein